MSCGNSSRQRSFLYDSLDDFVLEAQVPNRLRLRSSSFAWWGTFFSGSGSDTTEYHYDGRGRLVERIWGGSQMLNTGRYDLAGSRTSYTSWDAHGRPTAGSIERGGRSEPFTITYDDATGTMESTAGELVQRDPNGNVIRELGTPGTVRGEVVFEILRTQEVCL